MEKHMNTDESPDKIYTHRNTQTHITQAYLAYLCGIKYLKRQQGHNNSHPADGHSDVCATLLCNHVHWAQEKHRPDDVIKHH